MFMSQINNMIASESPFLVVSPSHVGPAHRIIEHGKVSNSIGAVISHNGKGLIVTGCDWLSYETRGSWTSRFALATWVSGRGARQPDSQSISATCDPIPRKEARQSRAHRRRSRVSLRDDTRPGESRPHLVSAILVPNEWRLPFGLDETGHSYRQCSID